MSEHRAAEQHSANRSAGWFAITSSRCSSCVGRILGGDGFRSAGAISCRSASAFSRASLASLSTIAIARSASLCFRVKRVSVEARRERCPLVGEELGDSSSSMKADMPAFLRRSISASLSSLAFSSAMALRRSICARRIPCNFLTAASCSISERSAGLSAYSAFISQHASTPSAVFRNTRACSARLAQNSTASLKPHDLSTEKERQRSRKE